MWKRTIVTHPYRACALITPQAFMPTGYIVLVFPCVRSDVRSLVR